MNSVTTLTRVTPADASLLDRLWQFYELESSSWSREDIDEAGRFNSLDGFLQRLGQPDSFDHAYVIRHQASIAGLLLVGDQRVRALSILEFADLYVLPKYRGRGIAGEVIQQIILASDHPWLICVFRDDLQALAFWRRAFERLPFSSVAEVLPSDEPDMHEFIVNDPTGVALRAANAAPPGPAATASP